MKLISFIKCNTKCHTVLNLFTSSINSVVSVRRNVLPCKGITHYVLRPQPPPAAAGMIPIGGVGRHQQPALSQERPTDLPILKFSDPFASQFNSPLGQPA